MKYKGFLEIVVIIILLVLLVKVDLRYDATKTKNYIGMNSKKDVVTLTSSDAILSANNNNNETIIEYTNPSSSATAIGVSNIEIICNGIGDSKDDDERLVKKNLRLNVYFSLANDKEKYESIVINKGEKVYIHIEKEYMGEVYPINDVQCEYKIST